MNTLILAAILIIELVTLFLLLRSGRRLQEFINDYGSPFQLNQFAAASLIIVDHFHLMERFATQLTTTQHNLIMLYGKKHAPAYCKMFVAQLISASTVLLILFTFLAMVIDGDGMLLLIGMAVVLITPMMLVKELGHKVRRRRLNMTLELPEFLNKVTLLVNAGETVQNAMIRSIDQHKVMEDNPFYVELAQLHQELSHQYSFVLALDDFSKRCAVQEISIFCTTVMMNYRRGGDEFVYSLRELSRSLWERRKALAKLLGEEASSKLVFPMMLIFLVVMVVVAAPALMLMG